MNDAVDEVFAIHVPCKTAVQIFKKLVAVLECLFKNFFKGQVRGFRTSRISIPWVLFSIHIVLLIEEESCLQFCILKNGKNVHPGGYGYSAGVDF